MLLQLVITGQETLPEQEVQVVGHGELGRLVGATMLPVEGGLPGGHVGVELGGRHRGGILHHLHEVGGGHALGQLVGVLKHPLRFAFPGLGEVGEQLHPLLLREVGAAVHGASVGQGEAVQGPAAPAGHQLHGGHVHLVHIGPFLSVHLDAHEAFVHDGGHRVVLEALVLHHMAPMAAAVAHAHQHQLVLLLRLVEGLIAPGVPVHGVVGVLQQVGAGLLCEAVGVGVGGILHGVVGIAQGSAAAVQRMQRQGQQDDVGGVQGHGTSK